MKRREFIKSSCSLCITIGAGIIMGSLPSCGEAPYITKVDDHNTIRVPLSFFAEKNICIVRADKLNYRIALIKKGEFFTALLMRCTHVDSELKYTGPGFICHLHGSTFDESGKATLGPAELPLKKFRTEKTKDEILIFLHS